MGLICTWKEKSWSVNPERIDPVNDMSYSREYNWDEWKYEKEHFTVSYDAYIETGADVRAEIELWRGWVGQTAPFYIGFQQFANNAYLKSVNVSNIQLTTDGGWIRSATIDLTFEEAY